MLYSIQTINLTIFGLKKMRPIVTSITQHNQIVSDIKYHKQCRTRPKHPQMLAWQHILESLTYNNLDGRVLITPSVSYQKLRFTKYVGLRSFFAFLAQNYVRCIALTKHFPVS